MDIEHCKVIFEHYGGMMRTKELEQEKIYYLNIQQLIESGHVDKVRYGYYQWVNPDGFSEVSTVSRLFPDGIFCMETALRYYGYSDRTPGQWNLAVSKDSGKSRFKIDYPFVKPYYIEPAVLELGLTEGKKLKGYALEEFVADLLRAMGYRCTVSQQGGDSGIDITAYPAQAAGAPALRHSNEFCRS
ncbi:MAG: type IV toxin-antitoxin system AbiEi family antitoxin domain-containing protein [Candidatus Faecousia sp.]|nr:type IV toxin-antitoxin system AbiEi family antitoxin domain-containing protein [Candidatus Faecousia sp.]